MDKPSFFGEISVPAGEDNTEAKLVVLATKRFRARTANEYEREIRIFKEWQRFEPKRQPRCPERDWPLNYNAFLFAESANGKPLLENLEIRGRRPRQVGA